MVLPIPQLFFLINLFSKWAWLGDIDLVTSADLPPAHSIRRNPLGVQMGKTKQFKDQRKVHLAIARRYRLFHKYSLVETGATSVIWPSTRKLGKLYGVPLWVPQDPLGS